MEDITASFARPCVVDVKLGLRTWDLDASDSKVVSELRKCPAQYGGRGGSGGGGDGDGNNTATGFRISGAVVWEPAAGQYVKFDKHFGRGLTESTLPSALGTLLLSLDDRQTPERPLRRERAEAIVQKIDAIAEWVEGAECRHWLYTTSLLIVFEAAAAASAPNTQSAVADAATTTTNTERGPVLRLIDFAHATPKSDPRCWQQPGSNGSRSASSSALVVPNPACSDGVAFGLRRLARFVDAAAHTPPTSTDSARPGQATGRVTR